MKGRSGTEKSGTGQSGIGSLWQSVESGVQSFRLLVAQGHQGRADGAPAVFAGAGGHKFLDGRYGGAVLEAGALLVKPGLALVSVGGSLVVRGNWAAGGGLTGQFVVNGADLCGYEVGHG